MIKSLFALILLVSSAESVLACSPPPAAVYHQVTILREIFASPVVFDQIRALGGNSIRSVVPGNTGYEITLDNGCVLTARMKWEAPASNGLCPRMVGIETDNGVCGPL